MTRGRISTVRASMIILVFAGIYFLSTKYSEVLLIGYIIGFVIGIVFWLGAENDWKNSEHYPANRNVIRENVKIKESNKFSVGQTIIIIAAICTIIGTVILMMKECG